MQIEGTPEPPAALLQRARAAFRQQRQRLGQRRHLTAVPQPLTAVPGRRGAQQEEQFLYATDAYDIDIQYAYDTTIQGFVLQGQILARSPDADNLEGVEVRLMMTQSAQGAKPDRLRLTDALGQFIFSYIVEGEYKIALLFAEEEVILDNIVVKNKPSSQL